MRRLNYDPNPRLRQMGRLWCYVPDFQIANFTDSSYEKRHYEAKCHLIWMYGNCWPGLVFSCSEMEIASLLLVNRLFYQLCRMQIYGMKDLLLTQEQINNFDRAMDTKEIRDAELSKIKNRW